MTVTYRKLRFVPYTPCPVKSAPVAPDAVSVDEAREVVPPAGAPDHAADVMPPVMADDPAPAPAPSVAKPAKNPGLGMMWVLLLAILCALLACLYFMYKVGDLTKVVDDPSTRFALPA